MFKARVREAGHLVLERPAARRVYEYLTANAIDGVAEVPAKTIAGELGMSRRYVMRLIAELEEAGMLKRAHVKLPDRRQGTNRYFMDPASR